MTVIHIHVQPHSKLVTVEILQYSRKLFASEVAKYSYPTTAEMNYPRVLHLQADILILPPWSVNSLLARFEGWLSKTVNGLLSFSIEIGLHSDEPDTRKWQQKNHFATLDYNLVVF